MQEVDSSVSGSASRVTVLRPEQAADAADTIVAGHADYPAFRHLFADRHRRTRGLRPFFEATVRDAAAFGSALAVEADGHVAAVAVWLPPGAFPWTIGRKAKAAPALSRVLLAAPRAFPAFVRYGTIMEHEHPAEPHWYLEVLSVRPDHQRQGLGSRLVNPILQRADREDIPCYLETSDTANVATTSASASSPPRHSTRCPTDPS